MLAGTDLVRTVLSPYDEVADMTGHTDDALALMERALVSRDALQEGPPAVPRALKVDHCDRLVRVAVEHGFFAAEAVALAPVA